jgi:hypothetical protein
MPRFFLTPDDIAAIEVRGVGSVCRDLRNGFYRGAVGGGARPWRVLSEAYEKQTGITPGALHRDRKEEGADLTAPEQLASYAVKFWSFVDRSAGPNACHPWMGNLDTCGYGRFHIGGKKVGAHRIALNLATGADIERGVVRHSCDFPACCNPLHLSVGTQSDNMADRSLRNRTATGERNGRCKLLEETVILIKQDLAAGGRISDVARTHQASFHSVREIARNKTWKHLAEPAATT